MVAGLGAGLLAGALTTPADVVKTRMQTDKTGRYKGLLDCMGKVSQLYLMNLYVLMSTLIMVWVCMIDAVQHASEDFYTHYLF